jgi:hypothetical protein
MLVEWNWNSKYSDNWRNVCFKHKVSPNAVYRAEVHPDNPDIIRVLTNYGLRLASMSRRHLIIRMSPSLKKKQLKDYF